MDEALESAIRVFSDRNKKSFHLYQEALSSLPGGNTRTALYTAPFPVSIYKGEDYKLFDVDGHQ
jgi:glutamate-1-semialdehyde 2,1-aminomutase